MLNKLFSGMALLGLLWGAGSHAAIVTPGGVPYKAVVIPDSAPDSVRLGAEELVRCLRQAGAGELAVVSEKDAPRERPLIWLGNTAASRSAGIAADHFAADEFIWQNTDDGLVIVGRDYSGDAVVWFQHPWTKQQVYNQQLKLGAFGSAGTLQGVYRFLMKFCGVRWYWPGADGEVIPERKRLVIPALNQRQRPAFAYRFPYFCDFEDSADNALWFKRCGNGGKAPLAINHSLPLLVRHEAPDSAMFALVDGGRDSVKRLCAATGIGEPCLSNPAVTAKAVEMICGYFAANPEQEVFPMVPSDGLKRICECPACQAKLDREAPETGRFSNYVWGFVNAVAREVGKKYPDRLIGCIAYEKYLMPPSKVELEKNVAVQLCKNRGAFGVTPYHDGVTAAIEAWSGRTSNLYIWEYYLAAPPPWRGFPVFFPDNIAEDLRYLHRKGVKGEMIEAESWFGVAEPCPKYMMCPGTQHLNLYLTSQLYWNPELNIDELLAEYYTLFYGPAKEPMRNFWELARKLYREDVKASLHQLSDPTNLEKISPLLGYPAEAMRKLAEYLSEAEKATDADSVYRRRIETIRDEFAQAEKLYSRLSRKSNPTLNLAEMGDTPERLVTTGGEPAEPPTWFTVKDDGRKLSFKIACFEPEMAQIKADVTKNNDPDMWRDDSVEIYLAADPAKPEECIQFVVSASGKIVQYRYSQEFLYGFKEPDCTLSPRVVREANRWTVELEIPETLLRRKGRDRSFKMNLFRNRRINAGSTSCWSPLIGSRYYEPESFGLVISREKTAK